MFEYILAAVIALIYGFYYYFTYYHDFWRKAGVPGPKPKFLGNFPSMITQKRHTFYEVDEIYCEFKKQGAAFAGVFQLREPRLLLIDPELCKDALIRKFNNFHDNELNEFVDEKSEPLFARNPFFLQGERWKDKRAEITPAFTPSRIKALTPLINDVCKTMTSYITKQIAKSPDSIDTRELSAKFTTNVVASCIFDMDAQCFNDDGTIPDIRRYGKRLTSPSLYLIMYIAAVSIFPSITKLLKLKVTPKEIEDFFVTLMQNAERYRRENNITRADYLEHLINLKNKKGLSDMDMAAHGVTFFIDGFETSSIALAGCLYELAKHPDIQQRLRHEITDNMDADGNISIEKLFELKYLEQVILEALRLHSPALLLTRSCTEKITLQGFNDQRVTVNVGDNIILPLYSLHIDPEYYPSPLEFDPERFDEATGGAKPYEDKGVYYPFGMGPRVCLGRRFAVAQIKLAIVEIIKNFELTVDTTKTREPLIFEPSGFIAVPVGGYWLNYKSL